MPTPRPKSILIFNFFAGVLKRGIPLYVDNLCVAFENEGIACKQLRCPEILRQLPRPLLNLLFIFTEQFIAPVIGLGFDRIIYPYNSVALAGLFQRKSAIILHDFISSRGRNKSLAARYIKATQAIYAKVGGDVIYISRSTQRVGRHLHKFPRSRVYLFPNSFYLFMQLVSKEPAVRGEDVLLCSGWGKNKDLAGALRLYLGSGLHARRRLKILGLAGRAEIVDEFCRVHPEVSGRITVMPAVDDRAVIETYESAAWTWVHSMAEGYGRSIAEARLCGTVVVASNIAPFREQTDEATFLYRGLDEFKRAVSRCEASAAASPRRIPPEHELLRAEIRGFMNLDE